MVNDSYGYGCIYGWNGIGSVYEGIDTQVEYIVTQTATTSTFPARVELPGASVNMVSWDLPCQLWQLLIARVWLASFCGTDVEAQGSISSSKKAPSLPSSRPCCIFMDLFTIICRCFYLSRCLHLNVKQLLKAATWLWKIRYGSTATRRRPDTLAGTWTILEALWTRKVEVELHVYRSK